MSYFVARPKKVVYTYPSKKALASIMTKVRAITNRARHRTLADLLRQLNPVLRGWCNYFRHGAAIIPQGRSRDSTADTMRASSGATFGA